MKKVLICGDRSFAATGLYEKLINAGYIVDCFSRGKEESRKGNYVTGDVFSMTSNKLLSDSYDILINFIMIKNANVEENINYVKTLSEFCKTHKVKKLYQVSSISVYSNELKFVDEDSPIESMIDRKGEYASIKIAVDNFLTKDNEGIYDVYFIRPGYIYTKDSFNSLSGIGLRVFGNFAILLGNKKSTLPIIERSRLHTSILKILSKKSTKKVFIVIENNKFKKQDFLKRYGFQSVSLPKYITIYLASLLKLLRVITKKQFYQIKGIFKNIEYDVSETEAEISYSFLKNSVCVIGAGTFGSYLVNSICEKNKNTHVTIFDVGNEKIKNEDEIGYKTNIKKAPYVGTSKGRFFGFGGTSNKWGGQLLMFTKNDFDKTTPFMLDIIKLCEKYRDIVFNRFKISNSFEETFLTETLFTKKGIWLSYFNRNLFKFFKIKKRSNVTIIKDARVTNILYEGTNIIGLEYKKNNVLRTAVFDHYFLTTGAFETSRILLNSGIEKNDSIKFSDHLSQKIFKIKGSTKIGNEDFAFKVSKASLITKRIVGEVDGVSFYANPTFNSEFPFFQNIKRILFKKELSFSILKSIIIDMPNVFKFVFSLIVKKRIFVYKNEWDIYIEIENPISDSNVSLSNTVDNHNEFALDLNFEIGKNADYIYDKCRDLIKTYLIDNNVDFEEYQKTIEVKKSEDTYHPYGMMCDFNSLEDYFNLFNNMLIINTGILPRAGGINTAGAVFPIIEEYVQYKFSDKSLK
jgi:nucleoside-diphosphate-sugar epimerase